MSVDLPVGWTTAVLPQLIGPEGVLSDGDWVESKDQDPSGEVRLTQLADIGDGAFRDRSNRFLTRAKASELDCTFLAPNDVLIARMPDPLGRACTFPGSKQACVSVVDVCIVRPGTPFVQPRWLMHFINAPASRVAIGDLQKGSTRKRISKANLCTIPFPVPPTREQQRISDALDSYTTRLEEATALLERVQRNLKRYRASVLKAAVVGRLVPTEAELARQEKRSYEPASVLLERILTERRKRWEKEGRRGKYEEPEGPDTAGLPELPEGWCWVSPGQLFRWSSGSFLPKKDQRGGEFQVYGGNGVNGFHDQANVQEATLVIGRVGAHCGNVHITDGPAWITDNAIFAADRPSTIDLHYWRSALSVQNLNAAAGGTGQPYVNQKHLNELIVALPPFSEQQRIAQEIERRLSLADDASSTTRVNLARCARLRQSILKWAFEGKLVDQDPNDEPASALLERIRAEHPSSPPPARGAPRSTKKAAPR